MKKLLLFSALLIFISACGSKKTNGNDNNNDSTTVSNGDKLLSKYISVKLEADISGLTDNEKQMIPLLIEAAKIMDDLFWEQAIGEPKDEFLGKIKDDKLKQFAIYNYGPWDRLDDNKSFIEGYNEKPKGANFYPADMTEDEFNNWNEPNKNGLYSMVRRASGGELILVPYSEYFKDKLTKAKDLLEQAAQFADDPGLNKYLHLLAEALLSNDYYPSDMAWMEMKSNTIDIVLGPIETYEDQLFGYRASFEAYVLIKDKEWSQKLTKYVAMLPELQKGLPVEDKYKKEKPGSNSDLNAYDVVYYAGEGNSGGKTIAINLPNDERVQLQFGARRLQLKNVMRAKYDKIMVPIAEELLDPEQLKLMNFDAFFSTTMFHEVAHGLGIKNTINGKGTVRESLKEHASALEEGKADILGLYMITELHKKGEIEGDLQSYYVTFLAGIFRSVRFGAGEAHGVANMIRFNYFKEKGAFERNEEGKYKVNFEKMQEAMTSLSTLILTLQGDGDYDGVDKLVKEKGTVGPELQKDLDRLDAKNIPVDIVFEQGADVLGL